MKALIEAGLAAVMQANMPGLAMARGGHDDTPLPDEGTGLIVSVEIEHRAGPVSVADVTFRLETVVMEGKSDHGEYEQALRIVAGAVDELDCGLGVRLNGPPYYQGQGGGVDGNRWVSEIKYRFGVRAD